MLGSNTHTSKACSPYAVAVLRMPTDEPETFSWGHYAAVAPGGNNFPLAFLEVKIAVSRGSLDPHLLDVYIEMKMLELSDCETAGYPPKYHIIHVALQMTITHPNFEVYQCAKDVGVLFSLLRFCPTEILHIISDRLHSIA